MGVLIYLMGSPKFHDTGPTAPPRPHGSATAEDGILFYVHHKDNEDILKLKRQWSPDQQKKQQIARRSSWKLPRAVTYKYETLKSGLFTYESLVSLSRVSCKSLLSFFNCM